ncbi:hypothetical protein LX36DRAFT_637840, partial [Colletotrichum falcatum]
DYQEYAAASDLFLVPEHNGNLSYCQSHLQPYNTSTLGPPLKQTNGSTLETEGFTTDVLLLDIPSSCYNQRGPKRKQAYIWQCCNCGQGGISIKSEACRSCGYSRCAYCPVSKVRI